MSRYEAKINIAETIEVIFKTPLFTGDIGNSVHLEFYLRGNPYTAASASIYKLMADGAAASVTVPMKENVCEFVIPNIMHNVVGETELQITLLDDSGNVLTSGILCFETLEGLSGKTQIAGTNQYNDMTSLLAQVSEGIQQINRAEKAADEAEEAAAVINEEPLMKYKGAVSDFVHLPKTPEIGDSYNIKHAYIGKAYAVSVSKVSCGLITFDEEYNAHQEGCMYVDNPSVFSVGDAVIVFDSAGKRLGAFVVRKLEGDCISDDIVNGGGLPGVCTDIYYLHSNVDVSSFELDINETYYFYGTAATDDFIEVQMCHAEDNVVWTGEAWDNLSGEKVWQKTEGGGTIFGNPENQAITRNSTSVGGGVGEEPNIAGRNAFLICGVLDNQIVLEYPPDGNLPAVGEEIGYAYPLTSSNPNSGWKVNGLGTIEAISEAQTDYPLIDIPTDNRIESDTGFYVVLTLTEVPDNLVTSHIQNVYNNRDVRDRRVNCRLWTNVHPSYGNYQMSEAAFVAGKDNWGLGDASMVLGGRHNKSIGDYSITGGLNCETWEEAAVALGRAVIIRAMASIGLGDTITIEGSYSLGGGYQINIPKHVEGAFLWGLGLQATKDGESALGCYNKSESDTLFSIGNGTASNRSNAFEVKQDGRTIIPGGASKLARISRLTSTPESSAGWMKIGTYDFNTGYYAHSALLYLSNSYVGSKFNALVAMTFTGAGDSYHTDNGITFTQIAGDDISGKIGYYRDPVTNNLTFWFNKGAYQKLDIGVIYDATDGRLGINTTDMTLSESVDITAYAKNVSGGGVSEGTVQNMIDEAITGALEADY